MSVFTRIKNIFPLRQAGAVSGKTRVVAPVELRGQFYLDEVHQVLYLNDNLQQQRSVLQWVASLRLTQGFPNLRTEWISLSAVGEKLMQAQQSGAILGADGGEDMRASALALLKFGCEIVSTDMHIRRQVRYATIEFRIDGLLYQYDEITIEYADKLMRALYMLCKQQYRPRQPQDGSIGASTLQGTGLVNVRIACTPCYPVDAGARWMVLRLQAAVARVREPNAIKGMKPPKRPDGELGLQALGYTAQQDELLQSFVMNASGTIFFCGPMGSGKTSTMHRLSAHIARTRPGQRQAFIEQPVETGMPHAPQLDILDTLTTKAAGEAYAHRTRFVMRMDTNILGLGEIREPLVASTWLSTAETGMLMLSTMHTPDPFLAISRLRDMDPERLALPIICDTSIICGLIGQRLVRVLCDKCAVRWPVDDERFPPLMRDAIGTWGKGRSTSDIRMIGPGCPHCAYTGVVGRRVVAEVVDPDEVLMADFIEFGPTIARHRYHTRSSADSTMLEKAMGLVFDGRMDPFDVPWLVGRIRPYQTLQDERERALKGLGGRI